VRAAYLGLRFVLPRTFPPQKANPAASGRVSLGMLVGGAASLHEI
jgi:hypothetical protein